MKKQFLFLCAVFLALNAAAQVSSPNGNFETWNSGTYETPQYYPLSSNTETYYKSKTAFNCTKTTDSYHGAYAVQLVTNASSDTVGAYFLDASSTQSSSPSNWKGGIPYSQKPSGVRGYYKYTPVKGDSGLIILNFKKSGSSIGTYFFHVGGVHNAYTLFNFTLSPALSATPDTVIFAAAASNLTGNGKGMPGSTLVLDSVSFSGVASQPSMLNGDFETWQSQTIYSPGSWYPESGQGDGFARSTDVAAGNYAMELKTYLGNNNGSSRAQSGGVSTGYWNNACSCYKGGYPFANKVDTLVFSYKYAPAVPTDSAQVSLTFKKAGLSVLTTGMQLKAAANYTYTQLPLSVPVSPDSVIITLNSSTGKDTAFKYIGSDFKIDELHFKSQALNTAGIHTSTADASVTVYPNPVTSFATVEIARQISLHGAELRVYDAFGRVVKKIAIDEHKISFQKDHLSTGIYFYQLVNNNEILKTGKMLIE